MVVATMMVGCVLGHAELVHPHVVGAPLAAVRRADLRHHAIDLLQRQALGFRDEEVRKHGTSGTCRAPDVEHADAHAALAWVDHVRNCRCLASVARFQRQG